MIKYLFIFDLTCLTHFRGGKAEILQKFVLLFWAIEFQEKMLLRFRDLLQIEYVQRSKTLGPLLKHK
jgi:hypothetical protein